MQHPYPAFKIDPDGCYIFSIVRFRSSTIFYGTIEVHLHLAFSPCLHPWDHIFLCNKRKNKRDAQTKRKRSCLLSIGVAINIILCIIRYRKRCVYVFRLVTNNDIPHLHSADRLEFCFDTRVKSRSTRLSDFSTRRVLLHVAAKENFEKIKSAAKNRKRTKN